MVTRREFLKHLGLGGSLIAQACVDQRKRRASSKRPPNIVLILADDLGYADIGCYGARRFATPHLDRLAREGVRFTSFYVSQAVCSASRASLLTGCYSERVGVEGALMPWQEIGLHPEEVTIADMLKKLDYATGMFGKWHLGHKREFLPLRQGFDEYFGLPYSNDMWPVGYDGLPEKEGRKVTYPPLPLIDGEEKVREIRTLEDQAALTSGYTERAVRFIRKNALRPFFLYLAHSMPHVPLGASKKFRGRSGQGLYGDVIMEIDWSVGEILTALWEFGLKRRTLVIFLSDNGPWLNYGNHAGSAYPLREGKGTAWEGGVRVPCLMRWPGRIAAGSVCQNMASSIDILPTLAAIAGAALPEKPIDGVDILPLLEGRTGVKPRDHFFYYYGRELRAVRQGKWKLCFPHESRSYLGVNPGNDGFPGPLGSLKAGLELYDLESDVGERTNVAAVHPEVVARLEKLAEQARRELGDKLTNRVGAGVRPPGQSGQK